MSKEVPRRGGESRTAGLRNYAKTERKERKLRCTRRVITQPPPAQRFPEGEVPQ